MRRFVLSLLLLCPTVLTAPAGASNAAGATPMGYPVSQLFMPVESGGLRTHVDLQFSYTNFDLLRNNFNVTILSIQGQYALLDRFEVGLNIPILVGNWSNSVGVSGSTEFGNIELGLKGKLFGSSTGPLAVSIFADTTLPTGSGLPTREFAALRAGIAGSGVVGPATLGAATGAFWFINGNGTDLALYIFDLWVAVRPAPFIATYFAFQLGAPVHPETQSPGVAVTPALQFFPIPRFHIDIGARIAVNDNGRFYNVIGRAALVFGAGFAM
jgi:hypothetical protein